MKILMVSYLRGRPFIEDTAAALIGQKEIEIWHYIISTGSLVNYREKQTTKVSKIDGLFGKRHIISGIKEVKSKLGEIDILHFHLMHLSYLLGLRHLATSSTKIITHVWGSDFYKMVWWKTPFIKKIYKRANRIIFTNAETKIDFNRKFPMFSSKTGVLRFGLTKLDLIDSIKKNETIKFCKEKIGLPLNRAIVCIGYNASKNQNHIEIIRAIKHASQSVKSKCIFVFPLTYGANKEYLEKIKSEIAESEIDSILFLDFLSDEDVCRLRICSDIFIQVQSTDQFSGAMQEALYSGSKVITGAWLPYKTFINSGIEFHQVNKFADLSRFITSSEMITTQNSRIIADLSKWSNLKKKWISMYQEISTR